MVCCYVGFYPFYLCWYLPNTLMMRKLVYEFRKKLCWLYGITYHVQFSEKGQYTWTMDIIIEQI